jgi:hypothetical protein
MVVLTVSSLPLAVFAQDLAIEPDPIEESLRDRLFMPSIQMGFMEHNVPNLDAGLIIQTALEYRTKRGLIFRVNYDDFGGRLDIERYSAKIPLVEALGGMGYRYTYKKHNVFALVQTGLRFYEVPRIEELEDGSIAVRQEDRDLMPMRYTLGYEFEFEPGLYLNVEAFTGHFIEPRDYWSNDRPFFGMTFGISASLF